MTSANILCQLPQVNVTLRRKIMGTPSMVNYEYCHGPLGLAIISVISDPASPRRPSGSYLTQMKVNACAADFSLLNLPKGKSLGRSKPATNS